jgi:excisionase family DNA binding protein
MTFNFSQEDLQQIANQLVAPITAVMVEQFSTMANSANNPTNQDPERDFLQKQEVLKMLGMGVTTLHKLTSAKTLPMYKVGKRTLFKRSEVMALIENSKLV